jgi:YggT family protein
MIYIINLINEIFRIYNYIILFRVILSWVSAPLSNPIVNFIYSITEPVLRPFRIVLRSGNIGIDISPIIVFFLLEILRNFIIKLLLNFAY